MDTGLQAHTPADRQPMRVAGHPNAKACTEHRAGTYFGNAVSMDMRIVSELSTRPIEGTAGSALPTSEILVDGNPTGGVVSGAVLEAAVRADGRCLLFMTDDTPYEDALSIHLLDGRWRLLDSALLGAPYSTGSFGALELAPPDRVRFRFIGDARWEVQILPHPAFRLPLLADAPGVSRKLGFSRHFIVRGKPLAQSRQFGGKARRSE